MKAQIQNRIISAILIAAVVPIRLVAQDETKAHTQTRNVVKILSLIGGTQGGANGVTNGGLLTGWSNLTGAPKRSVVKEVSAETIGKRGRNHEI